MKSIAGRVRKLETRVADGRAIDAEPKTAIIDYVGPDGSVGESYTVTIPAMKSVIWKRGRRNP